ncbi:MAG: ATP-dependent helicase HrpB [Gammaproteobacteria bacterium]|nr:ATP-dependent helicase HrpB [Gammaproteobacteria bacterium]
MSFPVDECIPQLLDALASSPNVVLQAPPGAGKTTRVPLALLKADWLGARKILMLEPRRLAARSAARFMAGSRGEAVGECIGYRVRLDSKIGPNTRIEVVTEGILTRMLQQDPALEDYGVVIFDEFHERNLQSDLGLALCLDAQQGLREDLRIVVMSATLDGDAIAGLLEQAPIISSEGRRYPVAIHYAPLSASFARERRDFLQQLAAQIVSIMQKESGSVLVFLPGAGEIQQVFSLLQQSSLGQDVNLAPLFGQLSSAQQDAAIQAAPEGKRKIVLATSIAETSLTIEGIRIVIDSGLTRRPRFDPNNGMTRLVTQQLSAASAEQRSGRAGRLQEGVCYRLWSASTHLIAQTAAEIVDADLAPLLLELALWGVTDVTQLRWLDQPPVAHVAQARDLLHGLGALDDKGAISAHGKAMSAVGTHPRLAHMMLRGKELGIGRLACDIAALLSERDIYRGPEKNSDVQKRIDALRDKHAAREFDMAGIKRVRETANQWQQQLDVRDDKNIDQQYWAGVLLAFAYPDRIAQRRSEQDTRYRLSNGGGAQLNEHDGLRVNKYIVAANLDGAREARVFLAAAIDESLLHEYLHELIAEQNIVEWDERNSAVQARSQQRIGAIVIADKPWKNADPDAIKKALTEGIRKQGIDCLPWTDTARQFQSRVQFVHDHVDETWPSFDDINLIDTLEEWLAPFLDKMSRISHLSNLNMHEILLARLSWEQQRQLDALVPTHLTVPSGSRIRVDYGQFPPVLAVRLQEMFGQAETPCVANGKIPVLLHLLSPAQRPLQVTQDLAGFWNGSYSAVKKEMKGRYPKHVWPDDPMQAQATARAKPKNG